MPALARRGLPAGRAGAAARSPCATPALEGRRRPENADGPAARDAGRIPQTGRESVVCTDPADAMARPAGSRRRREVALGHGNMNPGVIRVGESVRRPRKDSSRFTERLLLHLEAVGFDGAPRWLGIDAQGREKLTWLPGRVAEVDQRLSGAQVAAAARLLRAFHHATCGSALADGQETVLHHDPGPYNMVFGVDELPYALIDFDLAAPGDALEDVGFAAWLCAINSRWLPEVPAGRQAALLRVFADSYGLEMVRRRQVVEAIGSCQLHIIRWAAETLAQPDLTDRLRAHAARTLVGCKREHAFMLANRQTFQAALG